MQSPPSPSNKNNNNKNARFGRLRIEDVPILEKALSILKTHHFQAGLHGTSLWNSNYKDIDLLVISESGNSGAVEFLLALKELETALGGRIQNQKGNETIGYDAELISGSCVFHISYVVLW